MIKSPVIYGLARRIVMEHQPAHTFAEVGSPVAKEEIRQRAEEQYKQEERDDPTAAGFGGDWGIADRAAHAADVRVYRFLRLYQFRAILHHLERQSP